MAALSLSEGYWIILPRDHAKEFFGRRDDDSKLELLLSLLRGPGNAESDSLSSAGQWRTLQEALVAIEIEDSILAQCVTGGRPMYQGDDHIVSMVRPDFVRGLAQQLATIGDEPFVEALPADCDVGQIQELRGALAALYDAAAKQSAAVVFVVKV